VSGLRRRAYVSLDAIALNASRLLGGDAFGSALADLRADAYGHGLTAVASTLLRHGIAGFVVSSQADHDSLTRLAETAGVGDRIVRIGQPTARDAALTVLGPALYGLTSSPELSPALRLVAEAVAVKSVSAGRGVSYGYTYRTASRTTLVLACLGYADGIPRVASNTAPVLVGGTRARVTGRIAMDQFVVDVGQTAVDVGDEVVLFGDGHAGEPTALDWSQATGLRSEVIVAGLGPRIRRMYTNA
jgi:alanine racemase